MTTIRKKKGPEQAVAEFTRSIRFPSEKEEEEEEEKQGALLSSPFHFIFLYPWLSTPLPKGRSLPRESPVDSCMYVNPLEMQRE